MSEDSFEIEEPSNKGPRRTTRSMRKDNKEDLQVLEDQIAEEIEDSNKTGSASKNRSRSRGAAAGAGNGSNRDGWISKKTPVRSKKGVGAQMSSQSSSMSMQSASLAASSFSTKKQ